MASNTERPFYGQLNPGFYADDGKKRKLEEENSTYSADVEATKRKAKGKKCGFCTYLWKTPEMLDTEDNEEIIKINIRNLVIYIVYIVVTCIITYGRVNEDNYFFPKVVQAHFLDNNWEDGEGNTYRDAGTIDNFWSWSENVLLEGLYWEKWYNDQPTVYYKHYIMSGMKLLGLPRIRQIRIRTTNNECKVPNVVAVGSNSTACVPSFKLSLEDKTGNDNWKMRKGNSSLTAWDYVEEEDLKIKRTQQWAAGSSISYPDGGFIQNLAGSNDESAAILKELKDAKWIDEGTSAVVIDFTVFNPNVNLFCQVQIMAEFPDFGGMTPSWYFSTVSLFRYETPFDFFMLACEFLFIVFTLYYIVEEIIEIVIHRFSYLTKFFNIVDLVIIGVSIAWAAYFGMTSYKIYVRNDVERLIQSGSNHTNEGSPIDYISLDDLVTQLNYMQTTSAVILFFAWIKVFKFLSFSDTMNQLGYTISRSMKDIFGFCIMFFLVFFAFGQFAFLLFGTKLEDFSTFGDCVFTQLRIILGDFDYPALQQASKVFGPVYFFLYIFFVFFVLINMFLAIIADTYSMVKEEMEAKTEQSWSTKKTHELFENAKAKVNGLRHRKKKIVGILEFIQENGGIARCGIEEWRPKLREKGYTETEIQAFFSKFDANNDNKIGDDELSAGVRRLEIEERALDQQQETLAKEAVMVPAGNLTTKAQMGAAMERIGTIEAQVTNLADKIEIILKELRTEAEKRQRLESQLEVEATILAP